VLDTSVFIALEGGRPLRRESLPAEFVSTVITYGELSAGVISAQTAELRAGRLRTLTQVASMPILGVDVRAAEHWARLRVHIRDLGRRMNVNDAWIAAIALAHDLPIVTQDDDFDALAKFPGLRVIRV
jgi:predicted nucleic acid-binding protein